MWFSESLADSSARLISSSCDAGPNFSPTSPRRPKTSPVCPLYPSKNQPNSKETMSFKNIDAAFDVFEEDAPPSAGSKRADKKNAEKKRRTDERQPKDDQQSRVADVTDGNDSQPASKKARLGTGATNGRNGDLAGDADMDLVDSDFAISGTRSQAQVPEAIVADDFSETVDREVQMRTGGNLTSDNLKAQQPSAGAESGPGDAMARAEAEAKAAAAAGDSTVVTTSAKGKEASGKEAPTEVVDIPHLVRHQVAIPPGYDYIPLNQHVPPAKPYRTYPFILDPFQKVAISCIERNESVLLSAHTSAGKTVVAEYAIALSLANKQRVIYTSPIKALSNQKYREFQQEFGDVGLMTGDVTINPSATCLVMTTEILRSMLYRGSEVMREVAWVIFDEIHYMRDAERGVVWEETIILLPQSVRHVFLSATIPNAMQFAEWIVRIHSLPCHVVYTDFRPTPLQHYLFPSGGDGIFLCVDEKGNFREDNFQKAIGGLAERDPAAGGIIKAKKKEPKKG